MVQPHLLPRVYTSSGEDLRGSIVSISCFMSFMPLWGITRQFDRIGLDLDFFLDINEAELLSGRYWATSSTAGVPLITVNSRAILPDEIFINDKKYYKVASSRYDFSPSIYFTIPLVKEVFVEKRFLYYKAVKSYGEWSDEVLTSDQIAGVFSNAYGESITSENILTEGEFPEFFNIEEGTRFMTLQFSPLNTVSPVFSFSKIALIPKVPYVGDITYWVDIAKSILWKGINPSYGIAMASSIVEGDRPPSNEGIVQVHEITYNGRSLYILSGTQFKLIPHPHLIVVDDLYIIPLVFSIKYVGESSLAIGDEDVYNFFVSIGVDVKNDIST